MTDTAPSPALTAPIRELAQRLSGTDEILLLWHPAIEQVELSVLNQATGDGFHIEIAPANAIDAFYHPYAYAARCESSYRMEQDERMIVNG
jgi:hypothetical protein